MKATNKQINEQYIYLTGAGGEIFSTAERKVSWSYGETASQRQPGTEGTSI